MATGFELAVEGYIDLAKWLVQEWGNRALKVAAHLDAGTCTADQAAADVGDCAMLGMQSAALVVTEALDAAAVMTGQQDRPHVVLSPPFSTSDGGGLPTSIRTLRLAGDLVADLGADRLPVSVVTIEPASLKAAETTFYLRADATGHDAVGYSGAVNVSMADGSPVESIDVWLLG